MEENSGCRNVVWIQCGVCVYKTTENVYLIVSDESQFVPLSRNSKVRFVFHSFDVLKLILLVVSELSYYIVQV